MQQFSNGALPMAQMQAMSQAMPISQQFNQAALASAMFGQESSKGSSPSKRPSGGSFSHYRRSKNVKAPRKRTFIAHMTKYNDVFTGTLESASKGVGSGGSSASGHAGFSGGQIAFGNVETPAAALYGNNAAGLPTGAPFAPAGVPAAGQSPFPMTSAAGVALAAGNPPGAVNAMLQSFASGGSSIVEDSDDEDNWLDQLLLEGDDTVAALMLQKPGYNHGVPAATAATAAAGMPPRMSAGTLGATLASHLQTTATNSDSVSSGSYHTTSSDGSSDNWAQQQQQQQFMMQPSDVTSAPSAQNPYVTGAFLMPQHMQQVDMQQAQMHAVQGHQAAMMQAQHAQQAAQLAALQQAQMQHAQQAAALQQMMMAQQQQMAQMYTQTSAPAPMATASHRPSKRSRRAAAAAAAAGQLGASGRVQSEDLSGQALSAVMSVLNNTRSASLGSRLPSSMPLPMTSSMIPGAAVPPAANLTSAQSAPAAIVIPPLEYEDKSNKVGLDAFPELAAFMATGRGSTVLDAAGSAHLCFSRAVVTDAPRVMVHGAQVIATDLEARPVSAANNGNAGATTSEVSKPAASTLSGPQSPSMVKGVDGRSATAGTPASGTSAAAAAASICLDLSKPENNTNNASNGASGDADINKNNGSAVPNRKRSHDGSPVPAASLVRSNSSSSSVSTGLEVNSNMCTASAALPRTDVEYVAAFQTAGMNYALNYNAQVSNRNVPSYNSGAHGMYKVDMCMPVAATPNSAMYEEDDLDWLNVLLN